MAISPSSAGSALSQQQNASYMVQVFCSFAPKVPQLHPLVVRVPEAATVGDVVSLSLKRATEVDPTLVLPHAAHRGRLSSSSLSGVAGASSSLSPNRISAAAAGSLRADHEDVPLGWYGLCATLGDGTIDAGTSATFFSVGDVLRQRPELSFPYMFALVYLGPSDTELSAMYKANQVNRDSVVSTTTQAKHDKLSAEKVKQVEERRADNVRKIEERRQLQERESLEHCDSHEVLRKEALRLRSAAIESERLKEEQQRLNEAERQRLAELDARAAEERELAAHKERMHAAFEAEQARLEAARRAVELAAERRREEQKRALAAQRAEWERTKEQRLAASLNNVISDLEQRIDYQRHHEESLLEDQRRRRAEDAAQRHRIEEVQHLEATRAAYRVSERRNRCEKTVAAEEHKRVQDLHIADLSEREKEAERARLQQWLDAAGALAQDDEDRYELDARLKRAAAKGAAQS